MGVIEKIFQECFEQFSKCDLDADKTKSAVIRDIERANCALMDRDCLYVGVSAAVDQYQVKHPTLNQFYSLHLKPNKQIS